MLKRSGEYRWTVTVKVVQWPRQSGETLYTATDPCVTESQLNTYADAFDDMVQDWAENVVEALWTPVIMRPAHRKEVRVQHSLSPQGAQPSQQSVLTKQGATLPTG